MSAVMKSSGLFYLHDEPGPDFSSKVYLDLLRRISVFEISGGVDFQAAADICLEKLASL